jgi:ADP-ribose pyrophosphatase
MRSKNSTSADLTESRIDSTELYRGRSFSFMTDRVRLPDGREAKKDYVKYPHAVGIVPFFEDGRVLLIRQFRYPAGVELFEIPAGKIDDPAEAPLLAARRELREETGFEAEAITPILSYFPCAAYSTEVIHLFRAEGLRAGATDPDDDEFIENAVFSYPETLEMIRDGRIRDGKTILSLSALRAVFGK